MQINYLGQSCFRLRSGQTSLVTDPFDPKYVGLPLPKTTADIITISHNHRDHNDLTRIKNEDAFVISGPGEYEIKGISVCGFFSFHDREKTMPNAIYLMEIEGVSICHIGDLGCMLSDKELEELDGVDVLLTRVGSTHSGQLSIAESIKLIKQIEPSVVIPMHYRTKEMTDPRWEAYPPLSEFLKEFGSEGEVQEKLVVNKGSLPEEMKLIILEK